MGVNFSSFEIGRRALRASQFGISVAGQNIANVNTPGYTRQSVQLSATAGAGYTGKTVGAGVSVEGVRSFRERFLESRVQTETGISGRLTARRDALLPVESALGEAGTHGITKSINGFFNSFSELEAHPSSVALRGVVVGKAEELTSAFQSTRASLVEFRKITDSDLRGAAEQVNALTTQVANLNVRIAQGTAGDGNVSELRDQRGELLRQISELTGARAVEDESGAVTLTLADGQALVVGNESFDLTVGSTPPDGLAEVLLNGEPAAIAEGKLRGLGEAIDLITSQIGDLDALARSVAERVNTLHASGSDLNGADGVPFFTVPAGGTAAITAENFSVSAAVKADPRLVVTASRNAGSGDATVARELAALLNDSNSTAGTRSGTFNSIFGSLVAEAGSSVKASEDALLTQQAILNQVTAQRDAYSGVSLDEEAISLMQYQKAYEAAARFLKIADEMTQTIISLGQ